MYSSNKLLYQYAVKNKMWGIENPRIKVIILNNLKPFSKLIINKKEIKNKLEPIFIKLAKPTENQIRIF